jgi:hypothetical protein
MEGIDADHGAGTRPGEQGCRYGHRAAQRIADEDGARDALGVDDCENVLGEFGDSPFLAVASGFAVPGEIESDHPLIVREGGVLAIPQGTIGQAAVNEDDGGIRRAGYRVRYVNAVNRTRSSMEHGFLLIVGLGIPQRKEAACGSCFQE